MSPEAQTFYQDMAGVLEYPDENFPARVHELAATIKRRPSHRSVDIKRFCDFVDSARREVMEELYVCTFDVQSICCLDVGYVMFGEDYRRGQFMAQLKMLEKARGIACGSELPDFLPNILRLLPRLDNNEAQTLVETIVAPAIDKMLAGFATDGNIYREPLAALREVIKEDFSS